MDTVAFFSDRAMLPGLHAALVSMLLHLDAAAEDLRIVVFADNLTERDKDLLRATHRTASSQTSFEVRDFSPRRLVGTDAFHGNQTAYGRLYLGELLPDCRRCLYLDCDLIVCVPVNEILDRLDGLHAVFAVGQGRRSASLHRRLYEAAGLAPDGRAFNSGVMAIDLDLWRHREVAMECRQIASIYGTDFSIHDQPLLNIVLHDSYEVMEDRFNTFLFASDNAAHEPEARIYHFVGSPKPWDPAGRLHPSFRLWKTYYSRSASGQVPLRRYASLRRVILTSRSTVLALGHQWGRWVQR